MPKWAELNRISAWRWGTEVLMLCPLKQLLIPQEKNHEFTHEQLVLSSRTLPVPSANTDPRPIPTEKLGVWWQAASMIESVTSDYYRFLLLTGCRSVEILGSKKYGYAALTVGDVDLTSGKILLRDTKNRSDHTVLLSKQALSIARKHCDGRNARDPLFVVLDGRKTLARINARAGTGVSGKCLRATFASIAEELVSGGVLKRMMNHSANNDVTLGHYVGKSEAQLRAGWQAVADFVEAAAKGQAVDLDIESAAHLHSAPSD
jgi:hypothetical protein